MNLSSLSNGLRVVTILLLSQNYSIMAINCTLCEDGSYPTDDTARVNFEEGTLDCERLHYLAKTVTNETVCAGLHVTGNVICGCGVEPPSPCTLCSDGTDLPDPGMTVLPGRSCQEPRHKPTQALMTIVSGGRLSWGPSVTVPPTTVLRLNYAAISALGSCFRCRTRLCSWEMEPTQPAWI